MKKASWKKYTLEFLSIFVAVISAFALNNWNDNRKDNRAESRILTEILNGLDKDLSDAKLNVRGHEQGIKACDFWRNIIRNKEVNQDSVLQYYFALTRDFISIQNTSGYETLKSKGFELIENDSLRTQIISLYEYDYQTLRKLEEEYNELQFQENYFSEINQLIAPYFLFDSIGDISGIELPIRLSKAERKILLSYLWKVQENREFVLRYYSQVESKIRMLKERIKEELK